MRTFALVLVLAIASAPAAFAQSPSPAVPRLQTCNGVTTLGTRPSGSLESVPAPCPSPTPTPSATTTAQPQLPPTAGPPSSVGGIQIQTANPNATVGGAPAPSSP